MKKHTNNTTPQTANASATPAIPTLTPIISANRPDISAIPVHPSPQARDQKIMVVAICRDRDGRMVITPIDVEHDTDDLTPMTDDQTAAKKLADQSFRSAQGDMMKALGALYEIYSHRLYRNQFRTFENFCFALYGTHRIDDVLMKKINARAKALKSEVCEGL